MTAAQNIVKLRMGGKDYSGWKSVTIERDLEAAVSSMSVAASWPMDKPDLDVHLLDEATALVGDDLVLTGYVTDLEVSLDRGSRQVGLSVASKTQDLVDCAASPDPGQWQNLSLKASPP